MATRKSTRNTTEQPKPEVNEYHAEQREAEAWDRVTSAIAEFESKDKADTKRRYLVRFVGDDLSGIARQRVKLGLDPAAPWVAPLGMAWSSFAAMIEHDEDIVAHAKNMKDKMDNVIRDIEAGYHLNSLGEVQGRGLDMDRAVILRQAAVSTTKNMFYVARSLGAPAAMIPTEFTPKS